MQTSPEGYTVFHRTKLLAGTWSLGRREREREREMGHTIRMEYRRLKRHLGRQMWILGREYEMSAVETSCTPPPSLIDQPSRSNFLLSLSLSLSLRLSIYLASGDPAYLAAKQASNSLLTHRHRICNRRKS